MKRTKIRLDVDRVEVATFETTAEREERGTVRAYATNGAWTCAYHCTWAGASCDPQTCRCPDTYECPIQSYPC